MQKKLVAFLWPSPENYARYVAVSDDAMHPTHEAFLTANRPKLEAATARGVHVELVEFDPDEMAAWCRRAFGKVDAQSRGAYAAFKLMAKQEGAGAKPPH